MLAVLSALVMYRRRNINIGLLISRCRSVALAWPFQAFPHETLTVIIWVTLQFSFEVDRLTIGQTMYGFRRMCYL